MAGTMRELAGVRVWLADAAGPPLRRERDALDLIGDARAFAATLAELGVRLAGEAALRR